MQYLRLYRNVKRGGWLVRDKQLRRAGKHHGYHNALAHAAGKLVRVAVHALFRVRNAHVLVKVYNALPRFLVAQPVKQYGFLNLRAGAVNRVERIQRILEYHAYVLAAHLFHVPHGNLVQIFALEQYFAAYFLVAVHKQAHYGEGYRAFAAAGFAYQRNYLAAVHGKINVGHGGKIAVAYAVIYAQILKPKQGLFGIVKLGHYVAHVFPPYRPFRRGSSKSRMPSPSILNPSTVYTSARPGNMLSHCAR